MSAFSSPHVHSSPSKYLHFHSHSLRLHWIHTLLSSRGSLDDVCVQSSLAEVWASGATVPEPRTPL